MTKTRGRMAKTLRYWVVRLLRVFWWMGFGSQRPELRLFAHETIAVGTGPSMPSDWASQAQPMGLFDAGAPDKGWWARRRLKRLRGRFIAPA